MSQPSTPPPPSVPSSRPSTSIPILLLKSPSTPTDTYHTLLSSTSSSSSFSSSSHTFAPCFLPVLTTTFSAPALASLTSQLSDPSSFTSSYGGIILTSQRAVQALGEIFNDFKNNNKNPTLQDFKETDAPGPNSTASATRSPSSSSSFDYANEEEIRPIAERWASYLSSPSSTFSFFVVGPATASSLSAILSSFVADKSVSQITIYGEDSGSGSELAKVILDIYKTRKHEDRDTQDDNERNSHTNEDEKGNVNRWDKRKRKLLFLVGEKRRDVIPRMLQDLELDEKDRIEVEEVVVYETKEREALGDELGKMLAETAKNPMGSGAEMEEQVRERWIVVFSPQGCQVLLRGLDWLDEGTGRVKIGCETGEGREKRWRESGKEGVLDRIMAIGPTTKGYLREGFGVEVDAMAKEPSAKGVNGALLGFMGVDEKDREG